MFHTLSLNISPWIREDRRARFIGKVLRCNANWSMGTYTCFITFAAILWLYHKNAAFRLISMETKCGTLIQNPSPIIMVNRKALLTEVLYRGMYLIILIGVCYKELKLPKTTKEFPTSRLCDGSLLHPSPAVSLNNLISKPSREVMLNTRLHLALSAEIKTIWILTSAPAYILIEMYFHSPCSGLILWISHDNEPVLFILYLNSEGNLLESRWRYRLYLPRVFGIFIIFIAWGRHLEITKSSPIPVLILSQYRIMVFFFIRMKSFVYCAV